MLWSERGWMGLNIGEIQKVSFPYTFEYKEGNEKLTRTDLCKLILRHSPTQSNFWHFNIWIESYNTKDCNVFTTGTNPDELRSKSNLKKRAQAVFELLQDIVRMPDQTKEITLPQQYYVR